MRRLSILVALLCASFNAWGLSFNPASPSTSGAYTVLWSQPLGCDATYNPYYDCYDLRESTDGGQTWNTVASAGYPWSTSGKTAGTYDYAVFYYMGAFPGYYDYPVESGTMVVQSQNVSFTVGNATATEGGTLTFSVTKTGSTSQTTGVSWTTIVNQYGATSDVDFAAASGTLSFAYNETTKQFTVNALQDNLAEYQEAFNVAIYNPTGPATVAAPYTGTGYINDDDPFPTVSISDATPVPESSDLVFTATLSNPAVYNVNVGVAVTGGSATAGDYSTDCCGQIGFSPFQTSVQYYVHTVNDTFYEGNETVAVTLSELAPGYPPIGDGSGLGTITDAADAPYFTINDQSISEGGTLGFAVTQNGASVLTHVVSFATANGTATIVDGDYTANSGTLSFPPTYSSQQTLGVSVVTIDESPIKQEAAETVFVNIGDGGLNGATINDSQGVGTITNDDFVSFTINDTSIDEGGILSFTVTRNGASDFTNAVSYATADGSALLSQNDYVATSGSLSFPPSTSAAPTQSIPVTTVDENPARAENTETVVVNLTNGGQLNGATIDDSQGVGSVTNDDSVSFTIDDITSAEGTVVGFTVTRNGLTDLSHSLNWATTNGTATAGSDFAAGSGTLNFLSTDPSTKSVPVTSTQDSVSEQNETFTVNLSNPDVWATIADSSGLGTITNDDAPGTPSSLSAPVGFTGSSVALTWAAGSGYLTSYDVETTFDGSVTTVNTGSPSTSYTVASLSTDGTYRFRVRACTTAGGFCSPWSNTFQSVRSNYDTTTGVPTLTTGSGDAGPSTGLTADFNGIVSGGAGVSPSGAATYTIPIVVAPGTRAMQPEMALRYSSDGGQGAAGWGWSLSGAGSAVARCPKTIAQDNAIQAVEYTANDRFCIDGQRLVQTSAGTYGDNGVKYRTELETFRDITSNGGSPSSPNSFTVRTADGSTLTYGGTAASNFQASGPNSAQVAVWLLRHVEDKYGNYYDLTYFEDETNGFFHLTQIDYTGHTGTPVSAPYARVEFTYEALGNIVRRYAAGSVGTAQERLKKIKVLTGGASVREYVLTYEENEPAPLPPSGMSRLTSIKLCAPTEADACTAPTVFDWINDSPGLGSTTTVSATHGTYRNQWVDLNADGRLDLVSFSNYEPFHKVALSTATGFVIQTWPTAALTDPPIAFGDVDGDGDADYVRIDVLNHKHWVSKSNGSGYDPPVAWTPAGTPLDPNSTHADFLVDMNGDGRADHFSYHYDSPTDTVDYFVSLSTGSGYTILPPWPGPKLAGNTYSFHDVNGDRRTDVVLVLGLTHKVFVNTGSSFELRYTVQAGDTEGVWTDMNGDSLPDYVRQLGGGNLSVSLWTGQTYDIQTWTGGTTNAVALFRDMNGDGMSDEVAPIPGTGTYEIAFSNGHGFVGPVSTWTGPAWLDPAVREVTDIDGDGKADIAVLSSAGQLSYAINQSQPVHLLQKVTDGLGAETVFEYKPMTDASVYTKRSDAVYPIADMVNAVHVVSRMRQSDGLGTGGYFDTDYAYEGFKADKSGRGSLGFYRVTAADLDHKVRAATTYAQNYPFVGLPTGIDVTITDKLDNGTLPLQEQLISQTTFTYAARDGVASISGPPIKYVCPRTQTSLEKDVESGLDLRTTRTENDPSGSGVPCDAHGNPGEPGSADAFGIPLASRVTVTDHVANPDVVYRTDLTRYFLDDDANSLLHLLTRQVAKPLVDGVGDSTKDRTTAITYVAGKGVVNTFIREPEQSAPLKLTTTFGYDNFGNSTSETTTPSETAGPPTPPLQRVESVQFDAAGRFPTTLTNAVGQITTLGVDARFGTVLTIDGPNATNGAFNDLVTRTFDAFGRMKDERQPDGSYKVLYLKKVGSGASGIADRTQAQVMIETGVQNTAWGTTPTTRLTPVRTFVDSLGRVLRSRTRAFDSSNFVHVDTFYDDRGRLQKTSEPYYEGQTPVWNTPSYDVLARPVGIVAADSAESTTTDYDGFTITTTDAGGRRNRLISDALGRPTRAENLDPSSVMLAVTEYLYDKAGNLATTQKRTGGNTLLPSTVVTNVFDSIGRRTKTTDLDLAGSASTSYVDFFYDSMDELRRQQTPRLRAQSSTLYTEFDYDRLGRLTARRDPSTSLTQTVTSTFTYDQLTPAGCEAGKGRLTTEALSGGGEPGITTTYCYSPAQFGRLANEKSTTGGTTYQTDFTFDVLGRPAQVRYPVTPAYPSRYAVNYTYSPRGYLERIAEAQGSNTVLFQTIGANARGQIEKSYLGDGSRTTRAYLKATERLASTNAAIGASQLVQNFVYAYDAIGNVSARGDLFNNLGETFGYDTLDRLTNATVTNGTGPHPVNYAYDDAGGNLGNLTHKSDISSLASGSMAYSSGRPHAVSSLNTGSATRTFTYNTNGSMTGGQVDAATRTLTWTSDELPASIAIGTTSRTFSYGADRQRYKQVWVSGGTTRTYTYVGEHYVKEVQGSSTEHKLYVYANGQQIGYVSDTGTAQTRYFHKDHLGSNTTIITNQNWAGREKLSYDPWGRRRSGTDWWSAAATASEERGYTGHEHLDDVTLIHMNGRLLDPKLGRVVSADVMVPNPLYSQSYNRFSYVYNNPLKYTDPSGFGPILGVRYTPDVGWHFGGEGASIKIDGFTVTPVSSGQVGTSVTTQAPPPPPPPPPPPGQSFSYSGGPGIRRDNTGLPGVWITGPGSIEGAINIYNPTLPVLDNATLLALSSPDPTPQGDLTTKSASGDIYLGDTDQAGMKPRIPLGALSVAAPDIGSMLAQAVGPTIIFARPMPIVDPIVRPIGEPLIRPSALSQGVKQALKEAPPQAPEAIRAPKPPTGEQLLKELQKPYDLQEGVGQPEPLRPDPIQPEETSLGRWGGLLEQISDFLKLLNGGGAEGGTVVEPPAPRPPVVCTDPLCMA